MGGIKNNSYFLVSFFLSVLGFLARLLAPADGVATEAPLSLLGFEEGSLHLEAELESDFDFTISSWFSRSSVVFCLESCSFLDAV